MQSNLVETLIGAIVIAIAAIFLVYGYSVANVGGGSGYPLKAQFDRIDGLSNGADVRISGIKVGSVVSQKLDDETYLAGVTMAIQPQVKIPDDSSARISMDGLLGGQYIAISPGGSPDYLEAGDEFNFTQGSLDLMGLIGRAVFSTGGGSDGASTAP